YFELGRNEEARKAYESALMRLPSSVDARIGLARLDGEAGKRDEAIAQLASVLKTAPDNVLALTSHAALCVNRAAPGDLEAAVAETDHALTIAPDDERALYVRGNALLASKNQTDAQQIFERLGKTRPKSPLADYGLARVAAAKGDRLTALTELRSALEKAKEQPGALNASAVRADPAFHFLQADADFAQLLPAQ
ncbi:MAG: tetratricopeptide repeat protein, partial [Myxococcaceae bacterium]